MPRENRETGRGGKNLFDFWSYLIEDLLHSKNNLFFIFFKTFFLWCRRYESALYGWVITTRRSIFIGSKINISPVIFLWFILWLKYCLFHCQGRYWLLYAWMSLLISSWTKGLKWFFFPCSLSIFGNKTANNVIQDFFHKVKTYFLTQILFFLTWFMKTKQKNNNVVAYYPLN